jgi:hypothetical protein
MSIILLSIFGPDPAALTFDTAMSASPKITGFSINLAKKRIHAAIKRDRGNPHNSQGLARAWMINGRRAMNATDLNWWRAPPRCAAIRAIFPAPAEFPSSASTAWHSANLDLH